ncbi:c-type cytochrome [Cycloclasticus pugetii]|jgi:cytochrome c553|uniref:c-type cytochrome n=1 Tax=Cycloclasticus pugetii TaxID=34068 RepID=UPI000915198A|nr:cytochrome c [Cycloclasticus pugetii]SHJ53048.1 Cytochrome c553 [Cycloclasticus pugetii]|tara:strand:+ start:4204 stop:4533 length:330 start_codon:yes stop_codon:yes gene_type:complete
MKQLNKMIFTVLLTVVSVSVIAAGDIQAGKEKSTACAACHGVSGVSASPMFPTIAGQHADYMVHTLKGYQSGLRNDPIMRASVAALTEEDIVDLAAYFASQEGLKTLKK